MRSGRLSLRPDDSRRTSRYRIGPSIAQSLGPGASACMRGLVVETIDLWRRRKARQATHRPRASHAEPCDEEEHAQRASARPILRSALSIRSPTLAGDARLIASPFNSTTRIKPSRCKPTRSVESGFNLIARGLQWWTPPRRSRGRGARDACAAAAQAAASTTRALRRCETHLRSLGRHRARTAPAVLR